MSVTVIALVSLEVVFVIGLPIVVALILRRRWGLPMRLAWAGAATFVASQIVHIPTNSLISQAFDMPSQPLLVQAVILGLSAGVFEEVARYLAYRFWQKEARSWRDAVFFGMGHGGMESILTGALVALTLINVIAISQAPDPSALGLPASTLSEVQAYWSMSLGGPVLAMAERVMAMTMQLSLSTLVVLCFRKSRIWPLFAAILWHAVADAVSVYVGQSWGIIAAEGALAVVALMSVGLLRLTYRTLSGAVPEQAAGVARNPGVERSSV